MDNFKLVTYENIYIVLYIAFDVCFNLRSLEDGE